MSEGAKSDYSVLQKLQVTCKTCGVSDSFYSNLSVEKFKARHAGHDVVGGAAREAPTEAPSVYSVKPAPKEELLLERDSGRKLSTVRVDLVVFPVLPDPVFRVRGFRENLEQAFITTIRYDHAAKVRDMLLAGEFIDHDGSGVHYTWGPEAIEMDFDVRGRLGMPFPSPASKQEPSQRLQEPEDSVAKTNEILFAGSNGASKVESHHDVAFVARLASRAESAAIVAPARPAKDERPEQRPAALTTTTRLHVPARKQEIRPDDSALNPTEEKEADSSLASRSSPVQAVAGNKKEAIRITQVLKAFRWKVEPVYTIGVMHDGMLSIETNRSQVSRALIQRVEDSGYRLTVVTTDQGKIVAWFKKTPENKAAESGSNATEASADGSEAPGTDDLEIEPDVTE